MEDQRNLPALNHQRKQQRAAAVTKDCLLRRRAQPQSPWTQPQPQLKVVKPRSLVRRKKPLKMEEVVRVSKPLWLNRETRNMATGTAVRNQVCTCVCVVSERERVTMCVLSSFWPVRPILALFVTTLSY